VSSLKDPFISRCAEFKKIKERIQFVRYRRLFLAEEIKTMEILLKKANNE
jgi:hypothetical protein